jgi:hypothetical protein
MVFPSLNRLGGELLGAVAKTSQILVPTTIGKEQGERSNE